MKTNAEPKSQASHFSQSTYAMLLRSEDRRRNILETVLYSSLMICLVAALMPLGHLVQTADKKPAPPRPIVATATSL